MVVTKAIIAADDEAARALDIEVGPPCLSIERHIRRAAQPLTAVRLVHRDESQKLVVRFHGG